MLILVGNGYFFSESLGLSQLVTQPTQVTNNTSTLIDHIYSTNEDNLSKVCVCQIGISDHFAVFCNRKINSTFKSNSHKSITYRSFKHFAETNFLNDLVLLPWDDIEGLGNIDEVLAAWYSLFIETVNKHAPNKQHRIKNDIQPDWLTPEILDSMKERDKLKKQGRFDEYKVLRNRISLLIQESKSATYKNKNEAGKDDPKCGASNKSIIRTF